MKARNTFVSLLAAGAVALLMAAPAHAVDEDAAKDLAKKNDCFKCHAVDKTKKGPSYKKIAAKYKGKADAEDKVMKELTTARKVKLDDGSEEDHKVLDTKDQAQIKNLAQWILAQ